MLIWPGLFQSFRHNQDNLITRNLYVIQIQTPDSVKHKTIANLWEIWQSWPNIKKPFDKSANQRWFFKWDITYWFHDFLQSWMCTIDWTITYPSFSQKFYFHLSGCLSRISVPFTTKSDTPFDMGNVPFPCYHPPWSWWDSRAFPDNYLSSAKSVTNGPPTCSYFSTLDVPDWVFVVVQSVISLNLTKLESIPTF